MAGDTALLHLVSQHAPGVDVLFLNTGYHFAETIGTVMPSSTITTPTSST